jgi:hypothetical protein
VIRKQATFRLLDYLRKRIVRPPLELDSGKAVHVKNGGLRNGNNDHWEIRSGAESKKDQIDKGHIWKDKTTGDGVQ